MTQFGAGRLSMTSLQPPEPNIWNECDTVRRWTGTISGLFASAQEDMREIEIAKHMAAEKLIVEEHLREARNKANTSIEIINDMLRQLENMEDDEKS